MDTPSISYMPHMPKDTDHDDTSRPICSETTLTRKSQNEEPKCDIECCKSKKCIRKISQEMRKKLHQEFRQALSTGDGAAYAYLRRYISQNAVLKQNGKRRKLTFHYRIPLGDDTNVLEVCQQGFLKIFDITERFLRNAREEQKTRTSQDLSDADVMIIKEPDEKKDSLDADITIVKVIKEGSCRCFNSSPVVFNKQPIDSTSKQILFADLEDLRAATTWTTFGIEDRTLEALYNKGYTSLVTFQSIDPNSEIQELMKDKIISRGQATVLRRFIGSINCEKHPIQFKASHEMSTGPPVAEFTSPVYLNPPSVNISSQVTANTTNTMQFPILPTRTLAVIGVNDPRWNVEAFTSSTTNISCTPRTVQTNLNASVSGTFPFVGYQSFPQMCRPIMSTLSAPPIGSKDPKKGVPQTSTGYSLAGGNHTIPGVNGALSVLQTPGTPEIPRADSQRSASNSSATSIPESQILENMQSPPDVSQVDAFVHHNSKTPPTMCNRHLHFDSNQSSKPLHLPAKTTSPFRVSSASPIGIVAPFKTPSPPIEPIAQPISHSGHVEGSSTEQSNVSAPNSNNRKETGDERLLLQSLDSIPISQNSQATLWAESDSFS